VRTLGLLALALFIPGFAAAASEGAGAGEAPVRTIAAAASEIARADSAWVAGHDDEARVAYRVVLNRDPQSVRANHRLALLYSRVDRLDSALVLIGRARLLEPSDAGLLLDEARLLSWAGRLPESIDDFDRLLGIEPDHREARLGRARVLGWSGRYAAADSMYAWMLDAKPDDIEALVGRAQNAVWRGRPGVAEAQYLAAVQIDGNNVDALIGLARLRQAQGRQHSALASVSRALRLDPKSRAATTLSRDIRAAQRPQVDLGFSVSRDSDHNLNWSRTLSTSLALADGLRGFLAGASLAAADPTNEASRTLGEVGIDAARGRAQLTLAAGGRWLDPSAAPARYAPTYRSSLSVRALDRLSAGVGFAHYPLDETAVLIASGLASNDLQGSVEAELGAGFALSAGVGAAWLNDGNHRSSGLVALMHPVRGFGSVGVLSRVLSYERKGAGYFSPDRFTLAEARTTLARSHRAWTGRMNAGLGAQQVGARATTQLAWRAAGEVQYGWATINRIVGSIGASNSAASSTTGAYRYLTAAVALRIGI
jgi:tetratricopeptide (TPR) repeat protein